MNRMADTRLYASQRPPASPPAPARNEKEAIFRNPSPCSSSSTPTPTPPRLWRPAAQRNLRNQWSNLHSGKDRWISAASEGRSHATALVNAYLSHSYLPDMDLGALKDMTGIQEKAREKLLRAQEVSCSKLISSYQEMVASACHLVRACKSMRCFVKGSVDSPLIQFCDHSEDKNDSGDGGGVPVFSSFAISHFENLAQEVVEMFVLELSLKRLLVLELLSICKEARGQANVLNWSDELYLGENNDLRMANLLSEESCQPLPPRIKDWASSDPSIMKSNHANHQVLQVYLTTWLADVNINTNRIREIFAMVEEAMQIKLS